MRGFIPSQEEIEAQCLQIQKSWTNKERNKRRLDYRRVKYKPRYIHLERKIHGIFKTIGLF